jgi:hypothetical protein
MQQLIGTREYDGRQSPRTDGRTGAADVTMRHAVLPRLALLLLLSCTVIPLTATAVNLNFLGNSPVSFFKQDDAALMRKNAMEVLESPQPNAKQSWSNPKTGASGFAEVTGQFTTADGTPCKRLRVFNKAGGMEGEATYPVCKYSGRGWVINADAQPAK